MVFHAGLHFLINQYSQSVSSILPFISPRSICSTIRRINHSTTFTNTSFLIILFSEARRTTPIRRWSLKLNTHDAGYSFTNRLARVSIDRKLRLGQISFFLLFYLSFTPPFLFFIVTVRFFAIQMFHRVANNPSSRVDAIRSRRETYRFCPTREMENIFECFVKYKSLDKITVKSLKH